MLASVAGSDVTSLINDDSWCSEIKVDGRRLVVMTGGGKVRGFGRDGQRATVPPAVLNEVAALPDGITLDGELLSDHYVIFDLLHAEHDVRATTLAGRRRWLEQIYEAWHPGEAIRMMPLATTGGDKRRMLQRVKRNRGEGVMFKRLDSRYVGGRAKTWLKHKLVKDVDVVVIERGTEKQNILVGLYTDDGQLVPFTEVASFTGDGPILQPGDVATISVLGVSTNGKPISPVRPRKRDDKAPEECTLDQLPDLISSKDYLLRWTK